MARHERTALAMLNLVRAINYHRQAHTSLPFATTVKRAHHLLASRGHRMSRSTTRTALKALTAQGAFMRRIRYRKEHHYSIVTIHPHFHYTTKLIQQAVVTLAAKYIDCSVLTRLQALLPCNAILHSRFPIPTSHENPSIQVPAEYPPLTPSIVIPLDELQQLLDLAVLGHATLPEGETT